MVSPPPCDSLGAQCRELQLTLRVAELTEDGPRFHDGIATWLLGHVEQMAFGRPYARGSRLLVDVTVHVPCKYLEGDRDARNGKRQRQVAESGTTAGACAVYGFKGRVPRSTRAPEPAPLRLSSDTFNIVQDRKVQAVTLRSAPPRPRALPTLAAENPCAGAPCRTGDNRRGAACCRDLTMEVVLPEAEIETEALLRSRVSPYLCKVSRTDEDLVECEVISACGYLGADDYSCSLHDLVRGDGTPAKPSICFEWPDSDPDSVYHPGCRLIPENRRPVQPR